MSSPSDAEIERTRYAIITSTAMIAAWAQDNYRRVLDLAIEAEDAGAGRELSATLASTAAGLLQNWAALRGLSIAQAVDELVGVTAESIAKDGC